MHFGKFIFSYRVKAFLKCMCFLLFLSKKTTAQDYTHISANNAGMAFSSINNNDFWAVFNNQANLSRIENIETGILIKNFYGLENLNLIAAGFASKYRYTASGLSYIRMAANAYSQHIIGLPISISIFKFIAIGGQISYLYTDDQQAVFLRHDFKADLGFSIHFNRLKFGYHLHHLALRNHFTTQYLTKKNTFGITFNPSDDFEINGSFEKYPEQIRIAGGIQFMLLHFLSISGGLSNYYETYSMGLRIHTNSFDIDFSATGVQNLGLSPHVGITKRF